MNETTKAICKLLMDHNQDELCVMFKDSDGMEPFTIRVENYFRSVVLDEVDWNAIATEYAELPF